jgi:hypothetical protein
MMNVAPISAEQPTPAGSRCPSCGAEVAADQRYCLSCGQPCSPLRLDFLDVLQLADLGSQRSQIGDGQSATTALAAPAGYTPAYLPAVEPEGALGLLRRYSGLLALLAVLLATGLIGLLIGHWTKSPASPSGPQVVKIEGGLPLAAAASTTATTPTGTNASSGAAKEAVPLSKAQEEKEVKEAEAATVKAPPPVKTGAAGLKKLSKSVGKAHKQEIEALTSGGKPIETGG